MMTRKAGKVLMRKNNAVAMKRKELRMTVTVTTNVSSLLQVSKLGRICRIWKGRQRAAHFS